MAELQTLAQMQDVDLEIDAQTTRLREIEVALGGDVSVAAARARVTEGQEQIARLERRLRDLEWDAERIGGEIAKDEERLYGGRVRNPKELEDIQRDIDQRRSRRSRVEDNELEVMTDLEAREAEISKAEAALHQVESAWQEQEKALLADRTEARARLESLRAERGRLAAEVSPASLTLYERLRQQKHGRAVSRIDRSTCLGCRIALPSGVVSHVRQGRETVFCPSCGRILTL